MSTDLGTALREEASRAPAPGFDLDEVRHRGSRRRRRLARITVTSAALAGFGLVAWVIGARGSDLPEVAAPDPPSAVGSGSRLVTVPFEPGSIVQTVAGALYVTAGSSSDPDEPGQLYRSEDGGDTWVPILDDPVGSRLGPIAAHGDTVVAVGWLEDPPAESSEDVEVPDVSAYRWYVRVDEKGVTELIGVEAPPIDDVAAAESGFVGVTQRYPDCQILVSADGAGWTRDDVRRCPPDIGGISSVDGQVLANADDGGIWVLEEGGFERANLALGAHAAIVEASPDGVSFVRPAVDAGGRVVAYGRIPHMAADSPQVESQDVLIAHSDDGRNWEVTHRKVEGDTYPYGVTGVEDGFISIVSGHVLFSNDGIDWTRTGAELGADLWTWEPGVVVDGRLIVPVGPPAGVDLARRLAVIELD